MGVVVAKAQQSPQFPWFLTAGMHLDVLRSYLKRTFLLMSESVGIWKTQIVTEVGRARSRREASKEDLSLDFFELGLKPK
jgi:hypothetical protein